MRLSRVGGRVAFRVGPDQMLALPLPFSRRKMSVVLPNRAPFNRTSADNLASGPAQRAPPLPHAVAKGCPYRCPRPMPNVLSHHVFARGHWSMPARQLSPGWSPHCRPFASADCACRAAVRARRHGSMPARQSPEWPPRTAVLRQCRADCAAAPPCSHDGIGACPHANHCWNGIPLLPAFPFLVRIVSSCHRVNATA
jgi:hypothetical protein